MKSIPLVQTSNREINQLQQGIKQAVDPLLQNPMCNGNLLTGVSLALGENVVNHGLGRPLQGWIVVGQDAGAIFYDEQSQNPQPAKTLLLVASAAVNASIYCF